MNDNFERARAETIKYHLDYYSKHKLFAPGSWLEKSDQYVQRLFAWLRSRSQPRVLDLGSGVGRNGIAVAMQLQDLPDACVECVDVLPEAIRLLHQYARDHEVGHLVRAICVDLEKFEISQSSYDLVIAISVLEHCSSVAAVEEVLGRIAAGIRPGGKCRLEFTTDRNVRDQATGEPVETFVETRLDGNVLKLLLDKVFCGWQVEMLKLEPYKEVLSRDGRDILWQSSQWNYIAQRNGA